LLILNKLCLATIATRIIVRMLLQIFLIGYGIVCNLLSVEKPKNTMDLPIAISFRKVLDDIVYVLRTSCQWKVLPSEFSSGSTCNK
jgi:hypothetical protein